MTPEEAIQAAKENADRLKDKALLSLVKDNDYDLALYVAKHVAAWAEAAYLKGVLDEKRSNE